MNIEIWNCHYQYDTKIKLRGNSAQSFEKSLNMDSLNTKVVQKVHSLCKKRPYSEFFWSVFSGIRTEYRGVRSISPKLVQMRENTDQKNSEYGHFLRSDCKYIVNFCC